MRNYYPINFLLALLASTIVYSQKMDSLILQNDIPKIENPNIKKLDSLHKKFNIALNKLYDEGYSVSKNEYQYPNFYHLQKDGIQIPLNDYLKEYFKEKTNSFKAYFEIEVDWNGRINYVKLIRFTGNIDNIDFMNLWKNIKANPATEFKIPTKMKVFIPFFKN